MELQEPRGISQIAMTRECPVCDQALGLKRIRHVQTLEDHVVAFENLPTDVCNRCGESLFSGPAVDRINQTLWAMSPAP